MALDNRYVTGFTLEQVFLDKDTGEPLAGGILSFFEDENRIVPKLVYQLTGAPPNYAYAPMPNPIILSSIGTIQDAAGNNVALYAFPYDALGNPELYYVTCTSAAGVFQFTRQAWPSTLASINNNTAQANIANMLTNPQFANVSFVPNIGDTINIAGAGVTNVSIAPGWFLNITTTGAASVTVTQNSITGVTAYPFNPPYTLTVTPGGGGANIALITLSQRLFNNPDIWSPQNAGSLNGWVASSILLAPASSIIMTYAPSNGPPQVLLNANNLGATYAEFNNTVQLAPATSVDNSNVGFVDIVIQLPVGVATTLSNIQVVTLQSNVQNIVYDQTPVNRQRDFMFNYFNPLLQYKPIPSYLVGWDFAYNPTQFLGPTLAASGAGANTSRYVWDQTICFQSANNGAAISRGTNGSIMITATNATQFALIQYLPQAVAREILNNPNSVNIEAITNNVGGLAGTISLWYTTAGALPSCAANNSIVATLNATGKPATFNGGPWTELTRNNLGDARFTVTASPNTTNFNQYGFSGWNINGIAATNTATFFAIVVGFATLGAASTCSIGSISLVPGSIPTRPGVKTPSEVLSNCEYYYQKSFKQGLIPAQSVGQNMGEIYAPQTSVAATPQSLGPLVTFGTSMVSAPTVTLFNPINANAQIYNVATGTDWSLSAASEITTNGFITAGTTPGGSSVGNAAIINYTADSRLGA